MSTTMLLQGVISGLLLGFVFALVSIGLTLIFGIMELVNFAYGEFLMIGMYTSYLLSVYWNIDPVFLIPIVAAFVALVGAATHKVIISKVLRKSMLPQILSTFGLSVFLVSLSQFLFTADYRLVENTIFDGRFEIAGVFIPAAQVFGGIISILLCLFVLWFMSRTELGKALRAVSEDREAAALVGINTEKLFIVAWGISGACAGIAGVVLSKIFYIYPSVGSVFSLTAFVIVALGGFGSIFGAIVGGIIIGLIQTLSGLVFPPIYKMVVVYGFYFLVLMIKPKGLFGKF